MIRVLGRANSFNVRKVLWTCAELGIAFVREDWGRGFRPTTEPEFLALNPIGLVPAVVDGDVVLRESNAICRYLASRYAPGHPIYPAGLVERARVEQWMDWANYETSISLRGAFLGGQLNEPPWNHPWFVERGRAQITTEVGQLEQHFRAHGPYVCGETFTLGDVPVGLVVNRWFCLKGFDKPATPAVAAYYERLSERPAYRAHGRNGLP